MSRTDLSQHEREKHILDGLRRCAEEVDVPWTESGLPLVRIVEQTQFLNIGQTLVLGLYLAGNAKQTLDALRAE